MTLKNTSEENTYPDKANAEEDIEEDVKSGCRGGHRRGHRRGFTPYASNVAQRNDS